jgi:hypothetical protein
MNKTVSTLVVAALCLVLGAGVAQAVDYYVDSNSGSDNNPGTQGAPWKSLQKLQGLQFKPDDSVLFKRDSEYVGTVTVEASGEKDNPITFKAYGLGELPRFSNPDYDKNYGRVFDVKGSYVVFEKLLFHDCAIRFEGRRRAHPLGAIFLNEGTHHNIVRECEFTNVPVGMRDNGDHGLITGNYFHDSTEPLNTHWGPMGVVCTGNHTEISHNTFINIRSVGTWWGADGGAIELDDHENQKNIRVHHNFSRDNSGFLECYERGSYDDVVVAYNVSDDYEKFLAINGTRRWKVTNNTAIRTRQDGHGFSDFMWFREWYNPNDVSFTNNIFVTRNADMSIFGDFVQGIAQDGESQSSRNNIFYCFSGDTDVGKPLGEGDMVTDPMFVDFDNRDLRLRAGSPAIGAGADLGYKTDTEGTAIVGTPDIGAYEFVDAPRTVRLFNGRDLDNWVFHLSEEDGKRVDPSEVWSIKDGVVRCAGTPFGYMRTKKTYRDFKLTVEWRWPEEPGNSGVFLRIFGKDNVWPITLEAQLKHGRAGDLIGIHTRIEDAEQSEEFSVLQRQGQDTEKPAGEWNRYEITCRREDVEVSINGKFQNKADNNMPYEGHIGLQSEGAPIEFRTVTLQPLD